MSDPSELRMVRQGGSGLGTLPLELEKRRWTWTASCCRTRMSIKNAIASVAVKDLSSAVQWYETLFGRPADSRPMAEVAEWKFERGGWLQVYENAERAGSGSCTLAVSSLDEQIADLKNKRIEAGEPMVSDKARVVMIKDPEGNSIAFAEAIDQTMAR